MQVNLIIAIAVLSIATIPLVTAAVAVNTTTVAAAAVGLSSRRPGDVERLNASNSRQDIIFPSTKWCGQDNIAAVRSKDPSVWLSSCRHRRFCRGQRDL